MGNWGHMRQGHFCKEKELWSGGGTKEQIESIFLGGVVLSFAFHWEICKKEREKFESTQLEGEWGFMARSKVNQIGNYLNLNLFIGIYFILQSTTMPYYLSPLNISPTNRAAICAPPC